MKELKEVKVIGRLKVALDRLYRELGNKGDTLGFLGMHRRDFQ